jgi:uncharacterized protein
LKILIDIGHPAHVHYFKNLIKKLYLDKHNVLIVARDKEVTLKLLTAYGLKYISRGKGSNSVIGKLLYIIKADIFIFRHSLKFKPTLFLSFASPYAAHIGWLLKKPHIVLDDTEHAKFGQIFYKPFSSVFLNPSCFRKDFGKKQILFNSYTELFYLHPNYFVPNSSVLNKLNINKETDYAIVRFVSWNANHDLNVSGLTIDNKIRLIEYLASKLQVFISSEGELPASLGKYKLRVPPEDMHDIIAFSTIYIGEGGTTASEAAMLGVPAIYINNLSMGYIDDEKEHQLLFQLENIDDIIEKFDEIINTENRQKVFLERKRKLLKNKIDPTAFLYWFIENYPESASIMKSNPDYQNNFR